MSRTTPAVVRDLHAQASHSAVWRAGAGAGKTYQLVQRVARLVEAGAARNGKAAPRLIVTTFTRKATQELKSRLLLHALTQSPPLYRALTEAHSISVTTLHGTAERFLRNGAEKLGLPRAFRYLTPEEAQRLARVILRKLAAREEFEFFFQTFGFRTLAELLREASGHLTADPQHAPATLDDFRQMARASVETSRQLMRKFLDAVHGMEFTKGRSAYVSALARCSETLKLDDDRERFEKLTEALEHLPRANFHGGTEEINELQRAVAAALKDLSKASMNPQLWVTLQERQEGFHRICALFHQDWLRAKAQTGALELEDVELWSLRLLREFPESGPSFRDGWDHWIVDEYQDTSPRQVRLLDAWRGDRSLFAVGDPQQSIYLFRGARPSVFSDIESLAEREQWQRELLEVNRRSRPHVMHAINVIAGRMGGDFHPMTPHRPASEDDGTTAWPLRSVFSEDADDEGSLAAALVQDLLAAGVLPGSIGILSPRRHQLKLCSEALALARIPHQLCAGGMYSERREIQDLSAFVRFLANPFDDANLITLLRSPWLHIGDAELSASAAARGPSQSLWPILSSTLPTEKRRLEGWLNLCAERGYSATVRSFVLESDFLAWSRAADDSGGREANIWKFLALLSGAERRRGFNPLLFLSELHSGGAEGSESDAPSSLEPNRAHLMTIHASKGLEFDHVILVGMRKQRSLETSRGYVFHEGIQKWTLSPRSDDDEVDGAASLVAEDWRRVRRSWAESESRRLLYVAITRARESLAFVQPKDLVESRWGNELRLGAEDGVIVETIDAKDLLARNTHRTLISSENSSVAVPKPWSPSAEKEALKSRRPQRWSVTRMIEEALENEGAHTAGRDKRLARGTSSSHEMSEFDSKDTLERAQRGALALAFGSRLHRTLELAFAEGGAVAMASRLAQWFPEQKDDVFQALQWMFELRAPPMGRLLLEGHREWGFSWLADDRVVQGRIDLWGVVDETLWIIDYKSGATASGSIGENTNYEAQLRLYEAALRDSGLIAKSIPARRYLVFPLAREVRETS